MEAEETMDCLQEFPEHHKMILDRLNEQREQDRFTDITLIVDGGWGGGLRRIWGFGSHLPFPSPSELPIKVCGKCALGPRALVSAAHMDRRPAQASWRAVRIWTEPWRFDSWKFSPCTPECRIMGWGQ